MHLSETLALPVDAHRTAQLLADPATARAVGVRLGALDQTVDVTGDATGAFTVTTTRRLPTDAVPAQLRGFVGAAIQVRQVEAWRAPEADGARTGTVVVDVAGAPVRLSGSTELRPAGPAAATLGYAGELRASIPLFGGAVEQAVAGAVRAALVATGDELRRAAG